MNQMADKDLFERMVDRVLAYRPKKAAKGKNKRKAKKQKKT